MNTEISLTQSDTLTIPSRSSWQKAWRDLSQGLCNWPLWVLLSWQDIRLRYRRSSLGPLWITISMAISIYTMGFLYGHLFKMDLRQYYPFLAAGMLSWNLISMLIIEGTNAFIEAENYLKQMKLPYTAFVMRVLCRCLVIFAHNILVIIPIMIFLKVPPSWALLMLIPGLLIIAVSGFGYGMMLAMLGARFRDVSQIIVSLMQVSFFLTPIMWSPAILPDNFQIIVRLNPFAQYIELLRAPLTGSMPSLHALVFTLTLTVVGILMMLAIFSKCRHRIIYWL